MSGYFHDGDLINIKHENDRIEFSIESGEIFPEDMPEVASQIQLTEDCRK